MLKFQKFFSLFLLSVPFYAYSQENIYAAPGQSTTVGERKVLQEDIPIKLTCAPGEEIKRVAIQLGDGITGVTSFPILQQVPPFKAFDFIYTFDCVRGNTSSLEFGTHQYMDAYITVADEEAGMELKLENKGNYSEFKNSEFKTLEYDIDKNTFQVKSKCDEYLTDGAIPLKRYTVTLVGFTSPEAHSERELVLSEIIKKISSDSIERTYDITIKVQLRLLEKPS